MSQLDETIARTGMRAMEFYRAAKISPQTYKRLHEPNNRVSLAMKYRIANTLNAALPDSHFEPDDIDAMARK